MRRFNTSGPVEPEKHYAIAPLERMDQEYVLQLVREEQYIVLHAPRRTGKTSALLALQHLLNSGSVGSYGCVYVNVAGCQTAGQDVGRAMRTLLGRLASRARRALGDEFLSTIKHEVLDGFGPDEALQEALERWAEASTRPLVLLIDEVDALVGDSLISVLRQLRSGYDLRPSSFPHSIVLCGLRDLRDYRIHSGTEGHPVAGGSAFNIAADSLRLGDFSHSEVESLLKQHTADTGQAFRTEADRRVWAQTQGQPWLVNTLCKRACHQATREGGLARTVTDDDVMEAQEQLVCERTVHVDQLADKLREDRVRRVIEPLLVSGPASGFSVRDYDYVRDLGLLAPDDPIRIANPIYAEVVPRELTYLTQKGLAHQTSWFVNHTGLNVTKLLEAFQDYFRNESEHWLKGTDNREAGPQLLLHAFLQRVLNGGGRIVREYAVGRGRTDLLIQWPHGERKQRFVIECKMLRGGLERTIRDGLAQTAEYMDGCAAKEGHLMVFDRDKKLWKDKVFRRSETINGVRVEVWGL